MKSSSTAEVEKETSARIPDTPESDFLIESDVRKDSLMPILSYSELKTPNPSGSSPQSTFLSPGSEDGIQLLRLESTYPEPFSPHADAGYVHPFSPSEYGKSEPTLLELNDLLSPYPSSSFDILPSLPPIPLNYSSGMTEKESTVIHDDSLPHRDLESPSFSSFADGINLNADQRSHRLHQSTAETNTGELQASSLCDDEYEQVDRLALSNVFVSHFFSDHVSNIRFQQEKDVQTSVVGGLESREQEDAFESLRSLYGEENLTMLHHKTNMCSIGPPDTSIEVGKTGNKVVIGALVAAAPWIQSKLHQKIILG